MVPCTGIKTALPAVSAAAQHAPALFLALAAVSSFAACPASLVVFFHGMLLRLGRR
jgi:hypothetical protein